MPTITVSTLIHKPIDEVWAKYTQADHIIKWNSASDDWHCPAATNDPTKGGNFNYTMAAKDGSMSFDLKGTYDEVSAPYNMSYKLEDGRKVEVVIEAQGVDTYLRQEFEPESENSLDMQHHGWLSILHNFKAYVEEVSKFRFEIMINAPVAHVIKTMTAADTYKEWTSIFNPTSHFIGTWEKGSKMLFLGIDEHGNKGGMISTIAEHLPYKQISIQHLGFLQGDQEIFSGPAVDPWKNSMEEYFFAAFTDDTTYLSVRMDNTSPEHESYFRDTWPQALAKLKELCEG